MPEAKGDFENVPTVVFSHPVIGVVGLTEEKAVAKYGADKIKCYTSKFTNLWYGPWDMNPDDKPKTAMKLVTLLPDEKVLGIHIIGKAAGLIRLQSPHVIISLCMCVCGSFQPFSPNRQSLIIYLKQAK